MALRGDRSRNRHANSVVTRFVGGVQRGVAGVLFWLAVVLPVCYVALFILGLDTARKIHALIGLVVLHLIALYGGRSYADW